MTRDAAYWGIPTLDIGMQATELVAPVTKWGTRRRDEPMPGTWHFYTHDYKFTHLIRDPVLVPATACAVAVEPNFTITPGTLPIEALWLTFLKRRLAWEWQQAGIRIIVDLNLDSEGIYHEIGLLGVPRGWDAYATRAHRGVPFEWIEREHALAVSHAGRPDPLFVVFGGGYRRIKPLCQGRGWPWVPEHRQVVEGLVEACG